MVRRQRGFNLIELMIGLTIALVGLASVSAMMVTFSKKRTAISQTLSAQDNGVMALYRLEKELAQAGYGLMAGNGLPSLQSCATVTDGSNSFSPLPVVITDGGSGVTDQVDIHYLNTSSGLPGTELNVAGGYTMTASQYNVRSSVGFAVGERVVATNSCTATTITSVSATAIGFATPTLTASANAGYLVNLGSGLVGRRYQVVGSALTMADYPAYTQTNLVDEIVYLKAQYGLAASSTGTTVTSWVSGATAITAANVANLIAIRVGVVARSALRENEVIDQPNPLPLLPAVTDSGGTTIGAAETYSVPDARYRYRAYSTVIPLRNVIWTR